MFYYWGLQLAWPMVFPAMGRPSAQTAQKSFGLLQRTVGHQPCGHTKLFHKIFHQLSFQICWLLVRLLKKIRPKFQTYHCLETNNWKNFKPYQLHKTLDAKELLAELRNGGGRWFPPADIVSVKKVTVIDVDLSYRGAENMDYKGIVKPSCWLTAVMDYGGTNITTNAWQNEILGPPLRPGEGIKWVCKITKFIHNNDKTRPLQK